MPQFLAHITITLRRSILDPQGKAIHHALESLGMTTVEDVRLGKHFELKLSGADRTEAERITTEACRKLLANSVMEDFAFTLEQL
jgi:phosphoribosylformylglycinamidine synthase PurS subunit